MISTLKYGVSGRVHIDLPPGAAAFVPATGAAECGGIDARPAPGDAVERNGRTDGPPAQFDVAAGTSQALRSPLNFPALRHATVPGDCVVLALAPGVPQAAQIVAAVVDELIAGGAQPEDMVIVRAPSDEAAEARDPRAELPDAIRASIHLATHNPADRDQLSYLAADDENRPIYLNRWICDADLVVPIGCMRADDVADSDARPSGLWNETLYPTFADQDAIDRLAATGVPLTPGQAARRRHQIDQVAWLLGVQAVVQVVPGPAETAGDVLVGMAEDVFREGRHRYRAQWSLRAPQRVDLVIAGIGGNGMSQSWENVRRSLEGARRVVSDGGAIALCTELSAQLGPALKRLSRDDDPETRARRLRKQRSPDAPLARLLVEMLDQVTIYLLSGLPEDVVERLGFAYVQSPEEISRLAQRRSSCMVVSDAQYALPTVAGET